jgi:exopolysaccharide biosynthesis protein
VLLLVVDGRQWRDSLGLSIPQLAELMLSLGCVEALNLDGGGSSAMIVGNDTVNHPSDPTGERADSDALLIFARPRR